MSLAAPGYQFDHDGKTYYLPRIIQGDRRRWQVWANAYALREAEANRAAVDAGWINEQQYAQLLDATHRKITAGKYHPQLEDGAEIIATEDGYTAWVWTVMARHDPRLTLAEVQKLIASVGARQFLEHWKLAQADPNPPAPQEGGASSDQTRPKSDDTLSSGGT